MQNFFKLVNTIFFMLSVKIESFDNSKVALGYDFL